MLTLNVPVGNGFVDIAAGHYHNVAITPAPGAVLLGSIGLTFTGLLLRRRRML